MKENFEMIMDMYNNNESCREVLCANIETYTGVNRKDFKSLSYLEKKHLIEDLSIPTLMERPPIYLRLELIVSSISDNDLDIITDGIIDILESNMSFVGGRAHRKNKKTLVFYYMLEINLLYSYKSVLKSILDFLNSSKLNFSLKINNMTPIFDPLLAFKDKSLESNDSYSNWIAKIKKSALNEEDYTQISGELLIPKDNIALLYDGPKKISGDGDYLE